MDGGCVEMRRDTHEPAASAAEGGVTQLAFRNGMARLGAAINVVTTDGPGGRGGFTASAVCSVTDTPPTLLVCLNRRSSVADVFRRNRVLCVNTLSADQEDLSRLFGGATKQEDRFAAAEWYAARTGAPCLAGALVSFDCEIDNIVDSGTHHVLFCRVMDIVESPDVQNTLIYFQRRYHRIG